MYTSLLPALVNSALKMRPRMKTRQLFDLLRRRTRGNTRQIDERILSTCAADMAVLVSDASAFTRRTWDHGILQFLTVMTRCYDGLLPVLEKHGGTCLSHNADNLLAVFGDAGDAVQAAIAMQRWQRRYNRGKTPKDQFHICIGIDAGPVIRLRDNVFGGTVNVASKIGEDLAGKNGILITREVRDRIGKRFRSRYDRSTPLGGRLFELYRLSC